jgi:hypothetical protein
MGNCAVMAVLLQQLHLANLIVPCGPLLWNQKAPNREYSNHFITDAAFHFVEWETPVLIPYFRIV